jgi:hypothetical protein
VQTDGQARVDRMQAEIRVERVAPSPFVAPAAPPPPRPSIRRDPPPIDPALIATDDPLKLRLAEELEYARRLIEALGDTLCCDPLLVTRHAVPLQSIDVLGQMLGHLAAVTRSAAPECAVDRIGMSDLRARLTRRSVV